MSTTRYIEAEDAASRLGVRKATLYAYVSRGMIRSRAVPGSRTREYALADVERMVQGKRARRDPEQAVYASLGMRGLPVLRSSLSLIEGGRLYYRGHDAVALCRTSTLEDVAALLWDGWPGDLGATTTKRSKTRRALPLVARLQALLAEAFARDPAAASLQAPSVRRVGLSILRRLGGEIAGLAAGREPLAQVLASGWGLASAQPLDAALILCADHELNVSAFTARCVASAGASPYMVVSAGLGALSGRRHGGHTHRVAAMLDETGPVARILARHLERDGEVPGFGHPLYPQGDPRAAALLAMAASSPARDRSRRFARAALGEVGLRPGLDFGLVTLCRSLGAPKEAPLALFALGRVVGWIAHALEQYATAKMIRPRAQYVGPRP